MSALGAQFAAYVLALSFSRLPVRGVVVYTKMADIFIPVVIAGITSRFHFHDYVFSCISAILFMPLLFPIKKEDSFIKLNMLIYVAGVITLQAAINCFFCINELADSLPRFLFGHMHPLLAGCNDFICFCHKEVVVFK